jgi:hypothetical protein
VFQLWKRGDLIRKLEKGESKIQSWQDLFTRRYYYVIYANETIVKFEKQL